MKKIAIVSNKMTIGGCEKALVSMLQVLPKDKYEVTLLLKSKEGSLFKEIPDWINIELIPFADEKINRILTNYLKLGNIIKFLKSIIYFLLLRNKGYYEQLNYLTRILPEIDKEYDVAISYDFPAQFPDWYCMNNIKAKKKITCVHSDVSKLINKECESICEKMYSSYDNIFCVSKDSQNEVINKFSNIKDKTSIFYNIISKNQIISAGDINITFDDDFDGIKIVTVGRLSKEKGVDLIPNILKKLLQNNYNVKWYCIGDGELRRTIEESIVLNNLDNKLVMLGSKSNPYPYMKKCDIYVQPSRYEAYCTTISEARCFNKPIISTNVAGTEEQIKHGKTGLIVDIDENKLYESIKLLINNKELRNKFTKNLEKESINTEKEMIKLYELID